MYTCPKKFSECIESNPPEGKFSYFYDGFANIVSKFILQKATNKVGWFIFVVCVYILLSGACMSGTMTTEIKPLKVALAIGCLTFFFLAIRTSETFSGLETGVDLFGVYTLLAAGLMFLIMNAVSTNGDIERRLFRQNNKKDKSSWGVLLSLGASAIIFGFLDNYGMKLGTDALEDGPFFEAGKSFLKPPQRWLKYNGNMTEKEYNATMDKIKEVNKCALKVLWEDKFTKTEGGKKYCQFPEIYQQIADANAMMGNTFSDFVGALLGAGVAKLFEHLTSISQDVDDDHIAFKLLQNPVSKMVMEAVFIAFGCLIPIGMHYGRARAELYNEKLSSIFPLKWRTIFNYQTFILSMIAIVIAFMILMVTQDDHFQTPDASATNVTSDEKYKEREKQAWLIVAGVVSVPVLYVIYALVQYFIGRVSQKSAVDQQSVTAALPAQQRANTISNLTPVTAAPSVQLRDNITPRTAAPSVQTWTTDPTQKRFFTSDRI